MVVLALDALPAKADLLFYEGFDYSTGPLNGKVLDGDSAWSTPHEYWVVESPGATYPGMVTTGNRSENIGNSHQTRGEAGLPNNPGVTTMWSTAGTYYFTYLVVDRCVISLSPGGLAQGFEMNSAPAGVNIWTYIIDGNGVGVDDEIKLVINPGLSLGEPDWSAAVRTWSAIEVTFTQPHVVSIAGPNLAGLGDPEYLLQGGVDEIRIATTWDEAVGISVPEPATLSLLALGGLLLRKRQKTL